jgi:hypothetical protein
MFGTLAHESDGFIATRQYGFSFQSDKGAWGIAQCEQGSVAASLAFLHARPAMAGRAFTWLTRSKEADPGFWTRTPAQRILREMTHSERLCVLMARMHYLRVPETVPRTLEAQGIYYKQYYNTVYGKGTPAKFVEAYTLNMQGIIQ